MRKLTKYLGEIESYLPFIEKRNESVSNVSVAWQLDHALRVINSVTKALESSNPTEYSNKFNFLRHLFLTIKVFPRGKSRAPKAVRPEETITESDIKRRLGFAKENIGKLEQLPPKSNFPHPYFGQLNLKQSINFLGIHTHHHLKIVQDIIKAKPD